MRQFDSDWITRLGEVQFTIDNVPYIMAVGFVAIKPDELYIRLWKNRKFVFGDLLKELYKPQSNPWIDRISFKTKQMCIEQATRFKNLKAFI